MIETNTELLRQQTQEVREQIDSIKQQSSYLGESAMLSNNRTNRKLSQVKDAFLRRRNGCIDMVTVLSEQLNEDKETILLRSGIDQEEFDCLEDVGGVEIP